MCLRSTNSESWGPACPVETGREVHIKVVGIEKHIIIKAGINSKVHESVCFHWIIFAGAYQITLTRNALILRLGVWNSLMMDTFSPELTFTSCCFNKALVISSSCQITSSSLFLAEEISTLKSLLLTLATNASCWTASSILPLTTSHETDSGMSLKSGDALRVARLPTPLIT